MAFRNRRFEKRTRKWNRRTASRQHANIFTRPSAASRAKSGIIYGLMALALLFIVLFLFFNVFGGGVKVKLVKDMTVEIYTHTSASAFIEEIRDGKVLRDQAVDTSSLGKKTCRITVVSEKGKEKEYEFQVTVVDTQAPTIGAGDRITVFKGAEVNLLSQARIVDNSNLDPELEIKGKWDINEVGEYPVQLIARDASGNKAEKEIILEVIDTKTKTGDYSFTTANGYTAEVRDGITYIEGVIIANKSFSLPEDYAPGLLNETYYAFYEMVDGAKEDGVTLWPVSDYRSYSRQEEVYNTYKEEEPETYARFVARPGHSEHQTGQAIDINAQASDDFAESEEGKWLMEHCWEYGFIYRYPDGKEDITGYMEESWHYRHVGKNLAEKLYNGGDWITLEEYFGIESKYND